MTITHHFVVKASLIGAALVATVIGTARTSAQAVAELRVLLQRFEEEPVFFRQLEHAQQIVSLGDAGALATLEPWLTHQDRHIRGNAAFVFGGLNDARGFEALYGILADRSDRPLGQGIPGIVGNVQGDRWWLPSQIEADRYYAVHLLGVLRDPRAVDVLIALLNDDEVAYKVAWALGEIGDEQAIAGLIDSLAHSDALVRTIAIQSLVQLRAVQARPYIEALVADTELPKAGDRVPVGDTARAALQALRPAAQ